MRRVPMTFAYRTRAEAVKKLRTTSATGNPAKQPRNGKLRQADRRRQRLTAACRSGPQPRTNAGLQVESCRIAEPFCNSLPSRSPPIHQVHAGRPAPLILFPTNAVRPVAAHAAPSDRSRQNARANRDRQIAERHARIAAVWLVMIGLGAAIGQASWHSDPQSPQVRATVAEIHESAPVWLGDQTPMLPADKPSQVATLEHARVPAINPQPMLPSLPEVDDPAAPATAPPVLRQSPQSENADLPSFGIRLATAAAEQTRLPGVYNPAYFRIGYPMGDIPADFGVCTDVVIRAYRALGIDLQQLVHDARVGSGDTNIDHRRVEVLRRFFGRFGESLKPSEFPEDYLPGDIVAYGRPGRPHRTSTTHIAIVSDVLAPTGRPMLVHNRGYGPMLEDALFADPIIGHFRFQSAGAGIVATLPGRGQQSAAAEKSRKLAISSGSAASAR